jgi:hypothetical protein
MGNISFSQMEEWNMRCTFIERSLAVGTNIADELDGIFSFDVGNWGLHTGRGIGIGLGGIGIRLGGTGDKGKGFGRERHGGSGAGKRGYCGGAEGNGLVREGG